MSEVLLDSTQTTSRSVEINSYFSPISLFAADATGINIVIQFVPVDRTNGGAVEGTPFDMYQEGNQLVLTDTNNSATVYGPCVFRLNASLTGSTVYMSRGENP